MAALSRLVDVPQPFLRELWRNVASFLRSPDQPMLTEQGWAEAIVTAKRRRKAARREKLRRFRQYHRVWSGLSEGPSNVMAYKRPWRAA